MHVIVPVVPLLDAITLLLKAGNVGILTVLLKHAFAIKSISIPDINVLLSCFTDLKYYMVYCV